MTEAVLRFAPSPTGHLHLGHAYAALFCDAEARRLGGSWLLRIEDIDPQRCRPEFETALIEDLGWLGLSWPEPVRRQSEHLSDHQAALDRLRAMGLVYPCFCTRAEVQAELTAMFGAPHLAPAGPCGPLYPGTCRGLDAGEAAERIAAGAPHGWRLNSSRAAGQAEALVFDDVDMGRAQARPELLGDALLARKDVPTSYHLAVVVDDGLQGITHVTRGEDLRPATHLHRLLQALLGLPPPIYRFHPLLTNGQGVRLSKRDRATSLRDLRAAGATPEGIREQLGFAGKD